MHIAIQATLGFLEGELFIIAELDLLLDVFKRDAEIEMRHLEAQIILDVVVVAPFMDAHLLRNDRDIRRRPIAQVAAMAELVDRNRRLMRVRHCPDDVLWAERGIATKEHPFVGRLQGQRIHLGHAPAVEINANIALDPREGIFLADRDQHVVAFDAHGRFAGGNQVAIALVIIFGLHGIEAHAEQPAVFMQKFDRHQEVHDRNALVLSIVLLPRRSLHFIEPAAHDNFHVLAAKPAGGPAAIHRGIAATQYDNPAANFLDMAKGYRRQPVNAEMDIGRRFLATGDDQVPPARRTRADEHRVIPIIEQRFQAVHGGIIPGLNPQRLNIADFLVDHAFRQAEFGDLTEDHAAATGKAIEYRNIVAHRR